MKYLLAAIALMLCVSCSDGGFFPEREKIDLQEYANKYSQTICVDGLSYLAYFTYWGNKSEIRLIPLNEKCAS